ncbi:hypothetical protein [Neobacillus kokaensis]|uniref:Uncharacterized protein n=1 Tax=Neobacillus kokaensis TaxID=2759023 RepID=A0ABQ3N658_9BACI|nr:hypothetical protein [Neobacillus kokaensis]GHH96656.1 hypothetical protein AM1BK_01990 [Neobacillus kokaensis]
MALCNEFSKVEEKLIKKMADGNIDIQLLASDGNNSYVCIGDTRIEPTILLLCYVTPEYRICNGIIGDRKLSLLFENELLQQRNEELRIIFDRRDSDEKCLHVYSKEYLSEFSEQTDFTKRGIIIAYIEKNSFAQLSIFNSELQHKISEINTKKESLIPDFRTNAFTLISSIFPRVKGYLQEEDVSVENKD